MLEDLELGNGANRRPALSIKRKFTEVYEAVDPKTEVYENANPAGMGDEVDAPLKPIAHRRKVSLLV
jgi:hypothetical protein